MDKKEILIVVAIAVATLVLFFAAGYHKMNNETKYENAITDADNIFETVAFGMGYEIVYDKETRVMYTISNSVSSRGDFTVLVNADGTPKLYNKEKNNNWRDEE